MDTESDGFHPTTLRFERAFDLSAEVGGFADQDSRTHVEKVARLCRG